MSPQPEIRTSGRFPAAIAGAIAAGVAAASFLPGARIWGVNHLAFYPVEARVVALAVVALAFVPPVARFLFARLVGVVATLETLPPVRFRVAAIAVAIVALAVFVSFRSSTNLLGDGQLIAQSFEAAAEGNSKVVMRSARAIVEEEDIAPGATLLYFAAAKVAMAAGRDPVDGIRAFNCLLGAIYVFLLLLLVRRSSIGHEEKVWLLVLGLFSAAMELYFGYMENYTPLVFFLFLYVTSGLLFLRGRISLGWPVALLAVSVYTHVQAWVFAPSLFFLLIRRLAGRYERFVLRIVPPALIAATVAGVGAAYFTRAREYLLPLNAADGYGILSPVHLADIANELLMLMPVLPLVLVLTWQGRKLAATEEEGDEAAEDRPEVWHFVTLMLIPCLAYLTVFDPEIGMARDWDLFGMFTVALVAQAILALSRYRRASGIDGRTFALFSTPALVLTIVLGTAWFGINASKWRTADRFETILTYDLAHGSYAGENLAIFYHDNGRLNRAITIMEHTWERWGNPRHAVRLAVYYEEAQRLREAAMLLTSVLERHPADGRARMKLLFILDRTSRWKDMEAVAREGTVHEPGKAVYYFYLGESLIQLGETDEGLAAFLRCLERNPPESAREHIEKRFAEYGKRYERVE